MKRAKAAHEPCPICGGTEFRVAGSVPPGQPGYGWAAAGRMDGTIQYECVRCVPSREPGRPAGRTRNPAPDYPSLRVDVQGRVECPGCQTTLVVGLTRGLAESGLAHEFVVCPGCGRSYHRSLFEWPDQAVPQAVEVTSFQAGRPVCNSCKGRLVRHPTHDLLQCRACGIDYHRPVRGASPPSAPTPVKEETAPTPPARGRLAQKLKDFENLVRRATSGLGKGRARRPETPTPPEPPAPPSPPVAALPPAPDADLAALAKIASSNPRVPRFHANRLTQAREPEVLEGEVARFWLRNDLSTLLLASHLDGPQRTRILGPPAQRAHPDTWRARVLDDVWMRYWLMTGCRVVRVDAFMVSDAALDGWLGLVGGAQRAVGLAPEGWAHVGADAARLHLCSVVPALPVEKSEQVAPAESPDMTSLWDAFRQEAAPLDATRPTTVSRAARDFLDGMWEVFRRVLEQEPGDSVRRADLAAIRKIARKVAHNLDDICPDAAVEALVPVLEHVSDRDTLLLAARVAAPFTPFLSEAIYGHLAEGEVPLSVHLTPWPG